MENAVIRHVVITGGEPFEQPDGLLDLATMLDEAEYTVQIETSGTTEKPLWIDEFYPWITLSPKLNMPGGTVQQWALTVCDEVKYPVACAADIGKLLGLKTNPDAQIWLQPVWVKDEAKRQQIVALCAEACMENNWRLSLQTHRFAGLR
jgi:7-carboxy-7-deazaguanine synthase